MTMDPVTITAVGGAVAAVIGALSLVVTALGVWILATRAKTAVKAEYAT